MHGTAFSTLARSGRTTSLPKPSGKQPPSYPMDTGGNCFLMRLIFIETT